ncbi:MAG TPA: O-antigen ligase family protein [Candidatus Deferrimicrobium sp.]|nr:O-antigen ligase family protein [Candidatus Deferrimicrobium sp.]
MSDAQRSYFDKVIFCFFALFIFSSTFSIAAAHLSLGIAAMLFAIWTAITRDIPFGPHLKWPCLFVALYFIWMALSALVGSTPLASLFILKEEWLFIAAVVGIGLFCVAEYRHRLVTALATGVALVSAYGIIQRFTGIHWFKPVPPLAAPDFGFLVCGNFSNSLTFGNYFGTASAFLLGFAVGGWKHLSRSLRWLCLAASILGIAATLLSYSRGAIIGLAVALIVLGVLAGRRYVIASVVTVIVLALTTYFIIPGLADRFQTVTSRDLGGVYEGSRVFIWKNSLKVIAEHPLFGVGQGNFKAAYTARLRPDIPDIRKHAHAHNDFLNIAAISGIPGALFFAGIWASVITSLRKAQRIAHFGRQDSYLSLGALLASVVFLVTSLSEATFADEEVRQLLMFVWAAGLWPLCRRRDETSTVAAQSS